MKTSVLFTMIIGILGLASCSQNITESKIPSVVLNGFNQEFSDVSDVEWEKKGSSYEVDFEIDNIDHEAIIEETGTLVKYKKELSLQELPEVLKSSLFASQEAKQPDDIHLLVIDENSYYQLEYDGLLTSSHKIYNEDGEEMKDISIYDK